jgi:hypothetical protein
VQKTDSEVLLLSKFNLYRYVEDLAEFSMKNPARLSADQIGTTPGTLTEEVLKLKPGAAAMKVGLCRLNQVDP